MGSSTYRNRGRPTRLAAAVQLDQQSWQSETCLLTQECGETRRITNTRGPRSPLSPSGKSDVALDRALQAEIVTGRLEADGILVDLRSEHEAMQGPTSFFG